MSSIGPQLPSQISKRKRASEEGSAPRSKHRRSESPSKNHDEVGLDDSDDDYGPRSPAVPKQTVGPLLPPRNKDDIGLDDSDDDYGPSAPTQPKPSIGPSLPASNNDEIDLDADSESDTGPARQKQHIKSTPPKRIAGPALPPASISTRVEDSSSDSEDDYGPALPNASNAPRPSIGPQMPPTEAAPQRDEWMLAPPTSSGYSERDPTRMRNRKFASKSSSGPSTGVSSIWTETPEEKLKRLQDAVLGREDTTKGPTVGPKRDKEEEERQRRIAANIEARRGKSLYDEHQSNRQNSKEEVEEDDDPSKRAFDREKDMSLGGKIGSSQRRELMNKAANFGGRFQKGSFL
ncbi:Fc.00g018910.m01.CDS01 [Cosmosporella sp. VM-42]